MTIETPACPGAIVRDEASGNSQPMQTAQGFPRNIRDNALTAAPIPSPQRAWPSPMAPRSPTPRTARTQVPRPPPAPPLRLGERAGVRGKCPPAKPAVPDAMAQPARGAEPPLKPPCVPLHARNRAACRPPAPAFPPPGQGHRICAQHPDRPAQPLPRPLSQGRGGRDRAVAAIPTPQQGPCRSIARPPLRFGEGPGEKGRCICECPARRGRHRPHQRQCRQTAPFDGPEPANCMYGCCTDAVQLEYGLHTGKPQRFPSVAIPSTAAVPDPGRAGLTARSPRHDPACRDLGGALPLPRQLWRGGRSQGQVCPCPTRDCHV